MLRFVSIKCITSIRLVLLLPYRKKRRRRRKKRPEKTGRCSRKEEALGGEKDLLREQKRAFKPKMNVVPSKLGVAYSRKSARTKGT